MNNPGKRVCNSTTICSDCTTNIHLKKLIVQEGSPLLCMVCSQAKPHVVDVSRVAYGRDNNRAYSGSARSTSHAVVGAQHRVHPPPGKTTVRHRHTGRRPLHCADLLGRPDYISGGRHGNRAIAVSKGWGTLANRQGNAERRTHAQRGIDVDLPMMASDYAINDGQPESRPFADRFGSKERFENMS